MSTTTPPVETVIAAARDLLGDRLSAPTRSVREQHSRGEDTTTPTLPDAVAFVETTEEVSRILALCHQHGVAVTPFGAGTSLEGHVNPVRAGISLDLSRMTAVLEVNEEDMDCLIEPGVTRQELNAFLRDKGLFFPVDPGSHATHRRHVRDARLRHQRRALRHHPRERAGPGGRAGRWPRDPDRRARAQGVERLRPDPAVHRLRGHARRHHQDPAAPARHPGGDVAPPSASSPTLAAAVETVITVMQTGIPVARIELLDEDQMEACIKLFEAGGLRGRCPRCSSNSTAPRPAVKEQAEAVEAIAADFGALGFAWATDAESRATGCGRRGTMPIGRRWR